MKEENLPDAVRWMRGFKRGAEQLEKTRRKEIREADTIKAIPMFDGLFEMAISAPFPRETRPLSKLERLFLGIDT
ncbi:MAG: hypothetical protein KF855_00090 [Acidobacteria bacterium]|nr:hypothetical protein [Acidobacteriota bacterium]